MQLVRALTANSKMILIYLLIMLTSFTLTLMLQNRIQVNLPTFEYVKAKGSSGIELHFIRTTPQNIRLKAITGNVTELGNYGINGGFFWQGNLLSIAVINDLPVKGNPGDYGSGWFNTGRKRGTLVWDEMAQSLSIQVVEAADDLKVTDRAHYWAQGGISMGLSSEADWTEQAVLEKLPAINEKKMRSGIVYDKHNNVYLVVSPTPCTGQEFRNTVKELVGRGQLVDGLFLDGDGSSQLKITGADLPGDHREIYQMISLLK
jgi:hypothetical protein